MSTNWFTSDWHINHKNILKFAGQYRPVDSLEEHTHRLILNHRQLVSKRDCTYFLGDMIFHNEESLEILNELQGRKFLVIGNHDMFGAKKYLEYFDDVFGVLKKNGYWISHAPIHPAELRGSGNIHGHVHAASIRDGYGELDRRYINVCPEATGMLPVSIDQIRNGAYWNMKKI